MQQLQKLQTEHEIREALKDLPLGIDATYVRALELIDAHGNSKRLRWVLRMVVCATRPLSLEELAEAVATPEMGGKWDETRVVKDATLLVDSCANLLMCSMTWENAIVVPFHASVKDFLLANPIRVPESLSAYALHPISDIHDEIARLCLRYLELRPTDLEEAHCHFFKVYALQGSLKHKGLSRKLKGLPLYEEIDASPKIWRITFLLVTIVALALAWPT